MKPKQLPGFGRKNLGQSISIRRGSCVIRGRKTACGIVAELGCEADAEQIKATVKAEWLEHSKRRRDGTQFVEMCACCASGGHLAGRCPRRTKIGVIGDSHSSVWALLTNLYINTAMARVRIPGMSAQGLTNVQARSQAARSIRTMLQNCFEETGPEWLFVVVGQVDIDFVFPYHRIQNPTFTFEEQLQVSMQNLFTFLRTLCDGADTQLSLRREHVVLHGVHLPPVGDEAMRSVLAQSLAKEGNAASDAILTKAIPTQMERTEMAIRWNSVLRDRAALEGYKFVSLADKLLDAETGLVHRNFVKPHEADIHLDTIPLVQLYREEYCRLGIPFALDLPHIPDLELEMLLQCHDSNPGHCPPQQDCHVHAHTNKIWAIRSILGSL